MWILSTENDLNMKDGQRTLSSNSLTAQKRNKNGIKNSYRRIINKLSTDFDSNHGIEKTAEK